MRAFRFLLERWTFDQVAAVLPTYGTPNCSVTSYAFRPERQRLELDDLNVVYGNWSKRTPAE